MTDRSKRHRGGLRQRHAGFSLLELLLVLFIMGLMTATTMLMTGGVEDQSKYDETKRRMELIRRAIIGDPTRTVNGGPEISGFVADIGRLPECVDELVEMVSCAGSTLPAHTAWAIDPLTGVGRGWRGPYLEVVPDADGTRHFRDGYGCDDWVFNGHPASGVTIQSRGSDCAALGDGSAADIPVSGVMPLVSEDDYLGPNVIFVNFFNQSTSAVTVTPDDWQLELNGAAASSFVIDGAATSAVTVAGGGNATGKATFSSRIPIGVYLLAADCTSCVGVNNDITSPFQISVVPRFTMPAFKWVISP